MMDKDVQLHVSIAEVLDWVEFGLKSDALFATTPFFHSKEPDRGVKSTIADELKKALLIPRVKHDYSFMVSIFPVQQS
jgi:hypothetical protein